MKQLLKTLVWIICFMLLVSCQNLKMYEGASVSSGFDTYIQIKLAAHSQKQFSDDFNESIALFKKMNMLFDIYNAYDGINNLYTINQNAGIQEVQVDPLIIELLKEAQQFYELSNGQLDITLGPVLKVWHDYRTKGIQQNANNQKGAIPSFEELSHAATCVGMDHLVINEEKNTVFLNQACASLDVGSLAKGFATEYVAKTLEAKKYTSGIIDAGGNNRTILSKLDHSPWRVGIRHPESTQTSLLVVQFENSMSFVTSGNYERFFIGADNQKYHHIIDPQTLYPSSYFESVTIITENSSYADMLSTILFNNSYEDGQAIIQKFKDTFSNQTLEVIWISKEPTSSTYQIEKDNLFITYTEGLQNHLSW